MDYIYGRYPRRAGWILKEVEHALAPHATQEARFAYGYQVAEFTEKEDLLLFVSAKGIADRTEEWNA